MPGVQAGRFDAPDERARWPRQRSTSSRWATRPPGDAYVIEPGHDAWVWGVREEDWVTVLARGRDPRSVRTTVDPCRVCG
jgi:hypothetical protein